MNYHEPQWLRKNHQPIAASTLTLIGVVICLKYGVWALTKYVVITTAGLVGLHIGANKIKEANVMERVRRHLHHLTAEPPEPVETPGEPTPEEPHAEDTGSEA